MTDETTEQMRKRIQDEFSEAANAERRERTAATVLKMAVARCELKHATWTRQPRVPDVRRRKAVVAGRCVRRRPARRVGRGEAVRVNGNEYDAKPLTVREMLTHIGLLAAKDPKVFDMPVHFLAMEDTDVSAYVTHVEIDAFDGTEADPDDPAYRAHWALCLSHEVPR